MGTALMYQVLQHAREKEMRAVVAETRSDNVVGAMFLVKLGFKLAGLDTQRESNHDLVKERATLVWYAGVE
jgi:ribosomal protein S18 acetylase RimI-like enzyme